MKVHKEEAMTCIDVGGELVDQVVEWGHLEVEEVPDYLKCTLEHVLIV